MKVTELLLEIPEFHRVQLADALESGRLSMPCTAASLMPILGEIDIAHKAANAIRELSMYTAERTVQCAWLRSLNAAMSVRPIFDLVWSGPEVKGVSARDTRQVFSELIESAERSIWASTYAYFDGPKVFELLSRQVDTVDGLRLVLLLNIQRLRGDTSEADDVVARFARQFWKRDWPGNRRPEVFYDPRSLGLEKANGLLHAKSLVVDEEVMVVTSANFTEAAFDRNFELGLLARDRVLAMSVTRHFAALIEQKYLRALPQ